MTKQEILRKHVGTNAIHFVDAQADGSLLVPIDSVRHLHDEDLVIGMLNGQAIGWLRVKELRQMGIVVNPQGHGGA